jgi:hypothetical protein
MIVDKGLLNGSWQEIREWVKSTSADRLTGRDHLPYRVPAIYAKCSISANLQTVHRCGKHQTGKATRFLQLCTARSVMWGSVRAML